MRWRPIKTAPKTGEQILLKYPSFSDDGESVVSQGCWVECHCYNFVVDSFHRGLNPANALIYAHWRAVYLAFVEHGGAHVGKSYDARSARVEPTHWQPLPK